MLPIPLKGIKSNFYGDATVVGIFLEDMEREYKKSIENQKEEEVKIPRRDVSRDEDDDIVKEEVDVFLETIDEDSDEEESGKFEFFRWLRELF